MDEKKLTLDDLEVLAAARQPIEAVIRQGELSALIPLYRVKPDAKDDGTIPPEYFIGFSWSSLGLRFERVGNHDVLQVGADNRLRPRSVPNWEHRTDGADIVLKPQGTGGLEIMEMIALAAKFGLTARFLYRKAPGSPTEKRQVTITWVGGRKGNLFGGDDHDRVDSEGKKQPRTFRVDRVRELRLEASRMPVWFEGEFHAAAS